MKLFALGPKGTNGHEAAERAKQRMSVIEPGMDISGIELCDSHPDVFKRAIAEHCLGVVPIENSSKGFVEDTIRDFWLKQPSRLPIRVIGEVQLPVHHVLVMRPGMMYSAQTPVMSHSQALDQCREHLRELGLSNLKPIRSTALAAKLITENDDYKCHAGLVSPFAAHAYDMQFVRTHMEDMKGNATRFHVLGHKPCQFYGNGRTAVLFWLKNKPGTLANVVDAIRDEGVNMSCIHSIPLGRMSHYAFYIEFDRRLETEEGARIQKTITAGSDAIMWLGSFSQDRLPPHEEQL